MSNSTTSALSWRSWFPASTQANSQNGWAFDGISLVTIVGEKNMDSQLEAITAFWTCSLPRLLPAPQFLLKPSRPLALPRVAAVVHSLRESRTRTGLNYFGNLIHNIKDLAPFEFRVINIKHSKKRLAAIENDPASLLKRKSTKTRHQFRKPKDVQEHRLPPPITISRYSPLNLLTNFSFALTCVLLALSAYNGDILAYLAVAAVSLSAAIAGFSQQWTPRSPKGHTTLQGECGDVVIRTSKNAFIVVHCDASVAHELYMGAEECVYVVKNGKTRSVLIMVSTFLLIASILLLGSCDWKQRVTIGSSYVVLNGMYWYISFIPKMKSWDMSSYDILDVTPFVETPANLRNEDHGRDITIKSREDSNYVKAMWRAIRETGGVDWLYQSGAIPNTAEWNAWSQEAESNASVMNWHWDAAKRRNDLLVEAKGTEKTIDSLNRSSAVRRRDRPTSDRDTMKLKEDPLHHTESATISVEASTQQATSTSRKALPFSLKNIISRLVNYMLVTIGFYEALLSKTNERVRWNCFCGKSMYDDFARSNSEYVAGIQRELDALYSHFTQPTSVLLDSPNIPSDQHVVAGTNGGGSQQNDNTHSGAPLDEDQSDDGGSAEDNGQEDSDKKGDDSGQNSDSTIASSLSSANGLQALWILPCFQYKAKGTKVKHVSIKPETTDTSVFQEFRKLYFEQRSRFNRFFDIRAVKAIHITNFHFLARDECDIADQQARLWPYGAESANWEYSPRSKTKKMIPQVSQNRLLHIWQNPQHASAEDFASQEAKRNFLVAKLVWLARQMRFKPRPNPANEIRRNSQSSTTQSTSSENEDTEACTQKPAGRAYIIGRTPKKIGSRLEYNEFEEPPQGWGMWMEEGVRIHRFMMILLILFILLSIVFVVVWEVENKGAAHQRFESTAVMSWVTGLVTMVVATIAAYSAD